MTAWLQVGATPGVARFTLQVIVTALVVPMTIFTVMVLEPSNEISVCS